MGSTISATILPQDLNKNPLPVPRPDGATQVIDGSASSQLFTVFSTTDICILRLRNRSTNDIYFEIGTAPTATAAGSPSLGAGQGEYLSVLPSQTIAVLGGILETTVCS